MSREDAEHFEALLAEGSTESLTEAHELLWAAERGRLEGPLEAQGEGAPEVTVDWCALEMIALKPSPLERLEERVAKWPGWVWAALATMAPFVAWLAIAWARVTFPRQDLTGKLAVLAVATCAVVLAALLVGAAVWASGRGARNTPLWLGPSLAAVGAAATLVLTLIHGSGSTISEGSIQLASNSKSPPLPSWIESHYLERWAKPADAGELKALRLAFSDRLEEAPSDEVEEVVEIVSRAIRGGEIELAEVCRRGAEQDVIEVLEATVGEESQAGGEVGEVPRTDPEEALEIVEQLVDLKRELAAAHVRLGVAQRRLDREEEALEAFTRAVGIFPTEPRAYVELEALFRERGEIEQAQEVAARARELPGVTRSLEQG